MKVFQADRKINNYDKISKMSGQANNLVDELKEK